MVSVVRDGGGHFQSTGRFRRHTAADGRQAAEGLSARRECRCPPKAKPWPAGDTARLRSGWEQALALICSLLLIYALYHQFAQLAASKASLVEREARLAEKTAELEQANTRIDTAVNHMIQGLVMYNPAGDLVVCNDRFIEMYGLPPRPDQTRDLDPHVCSNCGPPPEPSSTTSTPISTNCARRWTPASQLTKIAELRQRPHLLRHQPTDRRRRLGCDPRGHHRTTARRTGVAAVRATCCAPSSRTSPRRWSSRMLATRKYVFI